MIIIINTNIDLTIKLSNSKAKRPNMNKNNVEINNA